jgi:hypothetical protein
MKVIRVQSMYTMTLMYHMYKDRHMDKFKRVIRYIKLISMHLRLFLMHLETKKWFQGFRHTTLLVGRKGGGMIRAKPGNCTSIQ